MLIATHNGPFHADEIFACAILKRVYPQCTIIRTRNLDELEQADLRVDVGSKYNPESGDFDHHQGDIPHRDNGIPYASAGLVWKHFAPMLGLSQHVIDKLDRNVFVPIDAIDNGVGFPLLHDEFKSYSISFIVDVCNQQWNEEPGDHFEKTLEIASFILDREILAARGHEAAKDIVRAALEQYKEKKYFVLEKFCPWKSVAVDESDKLFCVHPGSNGNWNAYAVPIKKGVFENRADFPKAWAGLTDEELQQVSGVSDAVFCHRNLFIAVAASKQGAIKLAEIAMQQT